MPSQSGKDQPAVPNLTFLFAEEVSVMAEETLFIPASGFELEAAIHTPEGDSNAGVVICHPHPQYGGDMNNNVVMGLQGELAARGFSTLRFNFRGVGASGGGLGGADGDPEDVGEIIEFYRNRPRINPDKVTLAGYSYGAMVGLAAAMLDPRISALVGISPPVAAFRMDFLSRIENPLLVISGDRDMFCPLDQLRSKLPENATLEVVDGADHLYRGYEPQVGKLVAAFLERHT